eukprot:2217652-Pleurochrysis_carterae.AAC.1
MGARTSKFYPAIDGRVACVGDTSSSQHTIVGTALQESVAAHRGQAAVLHRRRWQRREQRH